MWDGIDESAAMRNLDGHETMWGISTISQVFANIHPFAFINWGWWLGNWGVHCPSAFALTLLFQGLRKWLGSQRYRAIWSVLALIGVVWGGLGLVKYLPHAVEWHRGILFLPWLLFAVGLAKPKEWMSLKQYLIFLTAALSLLVVFFLMTDWTNLEFNLSRRLRGLGPIDSGQGGGGGGGGMAAIGYGLSFSLGFILVWSPGIILLACILAVPPRFLSKTARKKGSTAIKEA
jgi:hypothetical protein